MAPHVAVLQAGSAATIELSKRKLSHFIKSAWHVLEPNTPLEWSWHIECIADHVQWMLERWMGRVDHCVENLVINVPPGSMKSLILNVFAPAWMWLECNAPSWQVMALSGSHDIAKRDARKMRRLIASPWYRESFDITWDIAPDQDALMDFANTAGGVRHSQTQNSAITGARYDAIFLDDPNDIKDISAVKLAQVESSWYAAGNRINDMRNALRIVIQQRTHESDLTGVILEKFANSPGTEHLCIPMELTTAKCACGKLECDTTLGKEDPRTEEGEILHPERNTPEVIATEKLRLGTLGTAGQLNQRPAPLEGGMFKRDYWRTFTELPRDKRGFLLVDSVTMSVDSTFGGVDARTGAAKGSSRVCILVCAKRGSTRYILDVVAKKMSYPDTKSEILRIYNKWIDTFTNRHMITKTIIENKGNGPAILADLSETIPGMIADNPITDKMSRANAMHPQCEAGNVRLLLDAPWNEEFIHELGVFPNGKYDDIVDALSQVLISMSDDGLSAILALCQ